MADKEEGQGTTPRGADWEVVSLAASAYAVAPGATIPKFKLEEKGDVVDKDKVETSNAYSCLVGKVDSSESVGGKLDTKEEENWAFKKLTETDFAENTTLLGINLSGKEQSVYGSFTLQSLHSEATIRELGDIELVRVKLPKKLKKRRQIEIDDGPAGYEEYIDYLFTEESQAPNLKILEQAYKWKKQKVAYDDEDDDDDDDDEDDLHLSIIIGVQTPNCIRHTVFDAVGLDYKSVTIIVDATTSATPDVHAG
ncbi:ATG8-interacting protein 2-like protein [Tanacetum coccineum]